MVIIGVDSIPRSHDIERPVRHAEVLPPLGSAQIHYLCLQHWEAYHASEVMLKAANSGSLATPRTILMAYYSLMFGRL